MNNRLNQPSKCVKIAANIEQNGWQEIFDKVVEFHTI
jgi:hypothetical protein